MLTADEILERAQWDFFWAPEDANVVDRPEVRYVHSPRDLTYLNAVVKTRADEESLPRLIEEVGVAHRGVRSRWLVCPQCAPRDLTLALTGYGYLPDHESYAYVLPVADYTPRAAPGTTPRPVTAAEHLRDWYSVVNAAFAINEQPDDRLLQEDLAICRRASDRLQRFVAYDDRTGEPVGVGDIRLFPALSFGYLLAGSTVPEARGRGIYSLLLKTRIEFARAHGISLVGLYARASTSGEVVGRQGFVRHGAMGHWERPAT